MVIFPHLEDAFWKPKEWVFLTLGFVFLASCWLANNNARYIFKNKWLSALFIYIILCFGWYFLLPIAFPGEKTVWNIWTLLPTLNVVLSLFLIHHLIEYTDSVERWLDIVKVLCWLGFAFSIYAILQFFGFDQMFPQDGLYEITLKEGSGQIYHMFTFLGNKMLSSNYIACITPLFLIFKKRNYYIGLVVSLIALCFFRSVFNLGVALIGILFILFLQGKRKLILMCLGAGIIFAILLRGDIAIQLNSGCRGRSGYWLSAIQKGSERIITGKGVGALERDFIYSSELKAIKQRRISSHNTAIDIFYDLGLIGLVIVGGYFYTLIKRIWGFIASGEASMLFIGLCGAMMSYLLMSMGSFPHKIAPLLLMGVIYIAGIEVHLSERRRI